MDRLSDLYKRLGYPSKAAFWRVVHGDQSLSALRRKDVYGFVERQGSQQVLKAVPRPRVFSTIVAMAPRQKYQLDLMVLLDHQIHRYAYVLGVIDVYSRYVHLVPLTSKQGPVVFKAFEQAIHAMGVPHMLEGDNEFGNTRFQKWAKDNHVNLVLSDADRAIPGKGSLIERFWGSLRKRIGAYRQAGEFDWPKLLPTIARQYNEAYHSGIKASPLDVWEGRAGATRDILVRRDALHVGDWVRLKLKRGTFSKTGDARLSDEIYRLVQRDATQGQRWRIANEQTGKAGTRAYLPDEMVVVPKDTEVEPAVEHAVAARQAVDIGRMTRRLQLEANQLQSHNLVNTQPRQAKRTAAAPARFRQ